jgi:hypothetical protein
VKPARNVTYALCDRSVSADSLSTLTAVVSLHHIALCDINIILIPVSTTILERCGLLVGSPWRGSGPAQVVPRQRSPRHVLC